MDQYEDDDHSEADSFLAFHMMLYGEDWHRSSIFPMSSVSDFSLDPMVETEHDDGSTINEVDPFSTTMSREEMMLQWLGSLTHEEFEELSLEEDISVSSTIEVFSNEYDYMYEDLLDIIERMGNVNIGLDAKFIDDNLNLRRYEVFSNETETCVICLDEMKHNEEASKLQCGHDFHFGCIKEWLMVKNMCPLCNQEAL